MARCFKKKLTRNGSNNLALGKIDWWVYLTSFILGKYETQLHELGLYRAITAIQYGISNIPAHFFVLLEMYIPSSNTFFIPNYELGIGLNTARVEYTHGSE